MPRGPDVFSSILFSGIRRLFPAERAQRPEDIAATLQAALAGKRLTLLECVIAKEEMVYPMVLNGTGLTDMVVAD